MAASPITQRKFSPDVVHQGTPYRRPQVYLAVSGAITLLDGIVYLTKAGVDVMTLAAPPVDMDGATLLIIATTANAHTVTQTTPGFNSAGGSGDVATFGGAIGDNMMITAVGGVWLVISTRNVTIA